MLYTIKKMAGLEKLVGFTGAALLSTVVSANPLYVNQNAQPGDGSGFTQPHYTCLQDALQHARTANADGNPNTNISQILVAEGVYTPDQGTGDRTRAFELVNNVKVLGGYSGNDDERDWQQYLTVLSGNLGDGSHSYHVVRAGNGIPQPPLSQETELDGFIITDGNANGTDAFSRGGGIYAKGFNGWPTSPTFRNLLVQYNSSSERGGGFYGEHASPTFVNVTIADNTAAGGGGIGMRLGGEVTLTDSTIKNNAATFGGGMYLNSNGTIAYIVDSTFEGNTAQNGSGGAIAMQIGSALFADGLTFNGNIAPNGAGGAIYAVDYLDSLIKNSSFSGQEANYGAVIHLNTGFGNSQQFDLTNIIAHGNIAQSGGGFSSTINAKGDWTNVLSFNNYAPGASSFRIENTSSGGGEDKSLRFRQLTTANNNGGNDFSINRAQPSVRNSIVRKTDGGSAISTVNGAHVTLQYNSVNTSGFTWNGNNNMNNTPKFVDPENGDFSLEATCASINAGNNDFVNGITVDLANKPRIANGNVDHGAYEYQGVPGSSCPADLTGDGVVNVSDLLQLLSAWGPNVGHPADLNGDGVVNVSDLLILLGQWGPCPVQINGGFDERNRR